jgi:predicted enzyme related to lactoylglutathione lyase
MGNGLQFGMAVQYVPDVSEARQFYVDAMGLPVRREFPTYVEFDGFAITSEQPMNGSAGPELYWLVDDAHAAFERVSAKAEVVMPVTQMPFGLLFAVKDPAGNPRYILQLAEERPSTAV